MEELIARGWDGLMARVGGPMTFRLIFQPAMAALLALRAGLKDAREGRPPYLWTVLTDPSQRAGLLHEGWKSIASVFVLAVIMDFIYRVDHGALVLSFGNPDCCDCSSCGAVSIAPWSSQSHGKTLASYIRNRALKAICSM